MPYASMSLETPSPFGRKTLAAAILAFCIGVLASAQPANALEGGFGGVHGWGGLYRDNRDVGYFPAYVAYGEAIVVEWPHPRRYGQVHGHLARHGLRRHRAVAHYCAPSRPVCHCFCD